MTRTLNKGGAVVISKPMAFYVKGAEGPLRSGELEKQSPGPNPCWLRLDADSPPGPFEGQRSMLSHLKLHRMLWTTTGVLALIAAAAGIWGPGNYGGIVSPEFLPGAYSQDVISAAASLALLVMAFTRHATRPKPQIIVLVLLGYLFYAYGIYVIERAYNGLYLVYMAVFALSFWTLFLCRSEPAQGAALASLPKKLRLVSASGALLQPIFFYPLWIAMLLPLMRTGL